MILDRLFRASSGNVRTSKDLADLLRTKESASGKNVTPDTAMQVSTVYTCVRILAESVGQLPIHLIEQEGRKKIPALKHPLFPLLHVAPNRRQTSLEFFEFVVASLALRGNAYVFTNRAKPTPRVLELSPLLPGNVNPRLSDVGDVVYDVATKSGAVQTYTSAEILHIPLMSLDGVKGLSPIAQARESIGLAMATEEHGARMFSNGAVPGGAVKHPNTMSEEAYHRLKNSFEERHKGSENAHKVAILEEGAEWESIGMTADDAQFLETRKFQRSEICGIFRVPPHMVGDLERATFSNIEHQSLDFVVRTLIPYLRRIEQRIVMQLIPPAEWGRFYPKFNEAALLRGDMTARGNFFTKLFGVGALSSNEIREYEDMNPREGGDIYVVPGNMSISNPDGTVTPAATPTDTAPANDPEDPPE